MPSTYIVLSNWDLAIAASLILLNGLLSLVLKLRLEGTLLLAATRTILQLLLIGFVLQWIFEHASWLVILPMTAFMTIVAGISAARRVSAPFRGLYLSATCSVWLSSWLTVAVGVFGIIEVRPWYAPQYLIPLLGMVLGNSMTGIALGVDRFSQSLAEQRKTVDTLLSLGATRWEAALPIVRVSVRTGMIPIINSMMVVGIVSLPGMMTGQLLSGISPIQAVRYQIVIMFLIAAATAVGTSTAVALSYRRFFNASHQLVEPWTKPRSRRGKTP